MAPPPMGPDRGVSPQRRYRGSHAPPLWGGGRSRPRLSPRSARAARFTGYNHSGMREIAEGGFVTPWLQILSHPPSNPVTKPMRLPVTRKTPDFCGSLSQSHAGLQTGRPAMSNSRQSRPLPSASLRGDFEAPVLTVHRFEYLSRRGRMAQRTTASAADPSLPLSPGRVAAQLVIPNSSARSRAFRVSSRYASFAGNSDLSLKSSKTAWQ